MNPRTLEHLKKYSPAYLIGFIGFLTSLGLFYALQIQEEGHILNLAQLGIETISNNVRGELNLDSHLLRHIATTSEAEKGALPPNLDNLLHSNPRVYALAEVSAPTPQVLTWFKSSPTAPIDQELFTHFLQTNAHKINISIGPWIAGPIVLPNKSSAFFMVYPSKVLSGENTRYLIALMDSGSLLSHNTTIPGIIFELYLNHQPLNVKLPSSRQDWILEVSETLDEGLWEIKAREDLINLGVVHLVSHEAPLSWLTLILGIFISFLLARSVALSELLKERSAKLDKINQDLTNEIRERARTEESKKNLEKALLQGQKLQAIGTLAGGIAHDFNNLLYAIRGYVELARDELTKESLTYKNLGKVLEGTYRGQDLVARILSFSRRQHHELIPLELNTEISGALSLLRPTIPESVDLNFQASTQGKIKGNKTQIHQVIVNLINNAVDAMDNSEGSIIITLSPATKEELALGEFSPSQSHNYCKIEVSDTGHGMDQSTVERIFEPFFTTKEVGRGTGLGLSTVHTIVKDHEGEIVVSSQPGKGTTFTLFFPEYSASNEEASHG